MHDMWARNWRKRVKTAYTEPHRRYHTPDHLARMFADAVPYAPLAPALRWAIWFHDFVYDPRRADNEEASALVARQALAEMDEGPAVIERAAELILATKPGVAAPEGEDARLLISLDLKILAEPPEKYDIYLAQIREEFAHVPEARFRAGRAEFMRRFLERAEIFPHPDFRQFEQAARANIARESGG